MNTVRITDFRSHTHAEKRARNRVVHLLFREYKGHRRVLFENRF